MSVYEQINQAADSMVEVSRFKKLAGFVFKALHGRGIVKLRGDSEVKHQLDVAIVIDGKMKRVLIECKGFDLSGEKIGLEVVRDFCRAIDDVNPDRAIVLTCNWFTMDAMKYAKSRNIKLAVLWEYQESGRHGCINTKGITQNISAREMQQSTLFDSRSELDMPPNKYFEIRSAKVKNLIYADLKESDIFVYEDELVGLKLNPETGEIFS